jgi:hypothetical protein
LVRSFKTGQNYALDMDALAPLARLASAVPPPKQHQTIYSGVLAAAAHWRPLITTRRPACQRSGPTATGRSLPCRRQTHNLPYTRSAQLQSAPFPLALVHRQFATAAPPA